MGEPYCSFELIIYRGFDDFFCVSNVWRFPRCDSGGGGAHVGTGGAGDGLPDDSPAGGSATGQDGLLVCFLS